MKRSASYEVFEFSARDGLRLSARKYGWENPGDMTVVCLAGITRNSGDFDRLASHLTSVEGGSHRVIALDARGRGQSEHDRNWKNYHLAVDAEDAIALLDAAGLAHVSIIGSSRGGLVAMRLASMRASSIRSVVLNDMGPVIDARGLVRIRKSFETRTLPKSMDEAADLLRRAGETLFPIFDEEDWRVEAQRLYRLKDGKIVLQFDRKLLKTLRAINLDVRLPDMWQEFAALTPIPLMTVRAENSDILAIDTVKLMQELHPGMKSVTAVGQGHAPELSLGGLEKQVSSFMQSNR